MRQVDAVIEAVMMVRPDFKKHHDEGSNIITDDLRKQVCNIVIEGILDGTINYDKDRCNIKEVNKYVPGMVSNWLRRSKVLNGNSAPAIQNPGSRIGAGDEKLKALKELRNTQVESDILAEIDKYIKIRINELKKEKYETKQKAINVEALPDYLRNKLNL